MSKADSRAEVLKYTNAAKDELKIAALLGYGKKDDFFELYNVIDDIKNQLHTEKSAAAWEKIKKAFADFKNQVVSRPFK